MALSQIAGVLSDIMDVERYIEASKYDTASIIHPLTTCLLRASFSSDTVYSLDVDDPTGDRIEMAAGDLERMAKTVLKYSVPEVMRIFGEEPSTTEE